MKLTANNTTARCPACMTRLDAAMGDDGADVDPAPGDMSVCGYCSVLAVVNSDLTMRTLKLHEYEALDSRTRAVLVLYQGAVRRARRMQP